MPPKKEKKAKKGGKKQKAQIDWAADDVFDKKRAMIYIEHTNECPIFLEKAKELLAFLTAQFPQKIFQLVLNEDGKIEARPGSFEISFSQTARTERVVLWSGIDKGPPRRDKFPKSYEEFLPEIERIFKKIYVEVKVERDSLMGFDDDMQDGMEGDIAT